ncbi:MAG: type II secretion system protein [Verrucomicrobia bacterium]|nr:MAG: type II secretion system protein [Verrucomicrobiota bacterium]
MLGRTSQPKSGFTLTEILVVVGIIALIAAMMAPSITKTIHNARRVRCASNLRQVGIVFAAFAHEHQDHYPQNVPAAEGGALDDNVRVPLAEGILALNHGVFRATANDFRTPQSLVCPATRLWVPSARTIALTNLSYCVNLYPKFGDAGTVLAADASLATYWRLFSDFPRNATNVEIRFAQDRHMGRGNAVYGDGHVESSTKLRLQRPAQAFRRQR